MNDHQAMASVIDAIVQDTTNYALLLAAIGTLAMALIELLKGLAAVRRRFHRYQFARWISDEAARRELTVLATGGERYADVLFDQATDRMLGQIQAAANLSLEFPDRYPHAYAFFTHPDLAQHSAPAELEASDSEVWARFASGMAAPGSEPAVVPHAAADNRAAQQARVRLGHLIARRLDSFQNRTQYLWARGNQGASIIVGTGLSLYALTRTTSAATPRDFAMLVALALLAGMLAPFAKDVVTAISGIRTKT